MATRQPTVNPSLIDSWIRAEANAGLTKRQAITLLNAMTGKRYTEWRVTEWIRGIRDVPTGVRLHMVERSLKYVMEQHGVLMGSDKLAQIIAARLV